jgi:hypothetical protein
MQFQEKGNVAGNTTLIVQLREGHTLFDREYLSVEDIVTEFSLKSKISTANMCLHDFENKIRKYDSVEESMYSYVSMHIIIRITLLMILHYTRCSLYYVVVQEFYAGRFRLYNQRKLNFLIIVI